MSLIELAALLAAMLTIVTVLMAVLIIIENRRPRGRSEEV